MSIYRESLEGMLQEMLTPKVAMHRAVEADRVDLYVRLGDLSIRQDITPALRTLRMGPDHEAIVTVARSALRRLAIAIAADESIPIEGEQCRYCGTRGLDLKSKICVNCGGRA
jgi:hypothetical protein